MFERVHIKLIVVRLGLRTSCTPRRHQTDAILLTCLYDFAVKVNWNYLGIRVQTTKWERAFKTSAGAEFIESFIVRSFFFTNSEITLKTRSVAKLRF
jgi:hypothetical protein